MKNLKIRYYLESKSKNIEDRTLPELIMAEINYGYSKINSSGNKRYVPTRYSLQESTLPSKFGLKENNFKFDESTFKRSSKNNRTIKNKMEDLERALYDIKQTLTNPKTTITPKELKFELNKRLRSDFIETPETTILDYLNSKIELDKADGPKSKKNSKKTGTIKNYVTVAHHIENYQIATKSVLTFEQFDKDQYWAFWDVLDKIYKDEIQVFNPNQPKKQRKDKSGFLVNSIAKIQSTFITTLRQAAIDEHHTQLNLSDTNLILDRKEASKSYYFESDILQKVIDSDVSENNALQQTKDYFIISCLTGMRYESMRDTQKSIIETFNEGNYDFKYIHSFQNKTSTEVLIPLLKPVLEIIKQRGYPKVTSNSDINGKLKKLFTHLEINYTVPITRITYSNKKTTTQEPVNTTVTTHDGRGTFYSNLYGLSVPQTVIDNITHPDKKTTNAMAIMYNKTTMLTKAKLFVDAIKDVKSDVYTF